MIKIDEATINRKLLFKYLKKLYSVKRAKELMHENINNLFGFRGLAWSVGKRDLEYFCLYFLQDTFVPKENNITRNLAPVHLEVWNELQKMFVEDLWDKEEFILPRGVSKSTIINKALSCWLHAYKKSGYTIVIGNKENDAVQFIADTKKMLENPYIVKAFGKLFDKKDRTVNKQELELTNNTKIQAFSWGSSVRGTTYGSVDGIVRPACIILDDVLSEDDVLNDGAKEKVLNKFYKEIAEVGDTEVIRNGIKIKSASKFLVIGTPLSSTDFINTVSEDVTFKVFHRRVVDFNIDDYFENHPRWKHYKTLLFNDKIDKEDKDIMLKEYYTKYKQEMIFETIWEKYECDKLAQKYFSKRIAFMQELMCDCQNVGNKWFKSVRTQSVADIEEHIFDKTMLICDPASSTNDKSDYSALAIGSVCDANGFTYIRKGLLVKLSFTDLCNKIIVLLKQYIDITHVSIEKNLYMGTDILKLQELIAKDDELKNRNITFINKMQKTNKDEKIATIIDPVNTGQIIFNEEDKKFTEQILDFSGQKFTVHDDAIDCVAQFTIDVQTIEVIQIVTILDKRMFF
ncbi:hypothetical protein G9F73_012585 [Clostridium estertheticum]|uniref:hypothetical protein n=1 Tax=Clostridium estertheticum TaxID=238834 RepID=UPI0013EE74B0|nr:hypothetical protein [Clostridium estertheticum]MBZ9608646.1 hypothetical protein [Clostridium estertheticum]